MNTATAYGPSLTAADTFDMVLDFSINIDAVVETLKSHWEYNLEDRRPGPAILQDGNVKATDLDLACLLATLAKRRAVVVLPKYLSSGTKKSAVVNQQVLSADNRRGSLLRLSSNQEYFSFNALVQDMNVQNADGSLGAPRYFHIIGKDGRWHPGWDTINFVADAKENEFITKFGLAVDATVAFKTFVNPARWTAFFGRYYFLTKTVIERLEEDARELRAFVKAKKPKDPSAAAGSWQKDDSEESFPTKTITVPVFEAQVDVPWRGDNTPVYGYTWQEAEKRLKAIDYDHLPALRFAARATELAWYKENGKAGGPEKAGMPAWLTNARFSEELVKRTSWRRLNHGALVMGRDDVALRYRIRTKDIEVADR